MINNILFIEDGEHCHIVEMSLDLLKENSIKMYSLAGIRYVPFWKIMRYNEPADL